MVECECGEAEEHGGVITNLVHFSDEADMELDGELLENELEMGFSALCINCYDGIDVEPIDEEYVEYPEEYEDESDLSFLAKEQLHGME